MRLISNDVNGNGQNVSCVYGLGLTHEDDPKLSFSRRNNLDAGESRRGPCQRVLEGNRFFITRSKAVDYR